MDYLLQFNQQPRYTYIEGINSVYDPMHFSNSFTSSQKHSNLTDGPTLPSYIDNGQMTLQNSFVPLCTEYSSQSSASGKVKSSSDDEPATDFTDFLWEDEELYPSDLDFLQGSDKRWAASSSTQNNGLKPASTEQPQRVNFSRQLCHSAFSASSEFVQAEPGQMITSHTKAKSRVCRSFQSAARKSSGHMNPKKVALHRIWMSCHPRSFPNGRKIRALAQLAEIPSKTAHKWLKEFVRLGLIPLSGHQVEQPREVACVTRHGRPTSPFQPGNLERKYICTDCHHNFKRKDDWIKHTSLNYLRSYWQCLDCEYQCPAKRSDKLKQHFESKHPWKKLVVDAAIHYHQIDGPFEKQCGFCGHICISFDDFTGHVSRHFEDSTADPPYDMRIWRDPWPSEEAEHLDHSEDDGDDRDDSDPEDGPDGDDDSRDFGGGDEEADDNQDSQPSGGLGPDNFSNYAATTGFDHGSASFDRWDNWRTSHDHKQYRHLASEWTRQNGKNIDSAEELSTNPRDKLWPVISQTSQDKSWVSLSTPFRILSLNAGLRTICLDRGPTVAHQLAKITSAAIKICGSLQPQCRTSATSLRLHLPEMESPVESFREGIFSALSRNTNNTSVTEWSPNQPLRMGASPRFIRRAMSILNLHSHSADDVQPPPGEVQREPDPALASQSGTFIMDISPPAKQPLAFTVRLFETSIVGLAPIECMLIFADATKTSPFCSITAIAVNQRRKTSSFRSDQGPVALTPQTRLDLPENDLINVVRHSTEQKRIFHHKFAPSCRTVPHILHPDIEGPSVDKGAPFTITFTVPQFLEEEGVPSSLTRSKNLEYICSTKADRDFLQSLIFGKALLFSAGIKKVETTGRTRNRSDDPQAVRMWLSKDCETKSITVYFRDSRTGQKLYKEYQILYLHPDTRKLRLFKAGAPVQLRVVEETPFTAVDSRRRLSSTSKKAVWFIGSADSAISKALTCRLHFSKDGDRAEFLKFFT